MSVIKFCRLSHVYLCIFFFPMACIYAVTGISYVCGYTGKTDTVRLTAALEAPPPQTPEDKGALVKKILADNGVPCPKGEGKEMRNLFTIGRPTGRHAVLEPARGDAQKVTVSINTPNLLSRLVLLHKAKGGAPFNIFGIAFGVALLLMYLSGFLFFWSASELRTKLTLCFAAGLTVTVIVILASV